MVTIVIIVGFMLLVAIAIINIEGNITGAVIKPVCECTQDADCDDSDQCTEDLCLYSESCEASLCVNKEIKDCA